jgi:hypothetical protein
MTQHDYVIHIQELGNRRCRFERRFLQYGGDLWVDVIERWSSGSMLMMKVFSAALYPARPELDREQAVGLLTELSPSYRVNFVSVDRFIGEEFNNHSFLVFHGMKA